MLLVVETEFVAALRVRLHSCIATTKKRSILGICNARTRGFSISILPSEFCRLFVT